MGKGTYGSKVGRPKAKKLPKNTKKNPKDVVMARKKLGLYANIHAKRKRIKAGSGEKDEKERC